MTAVAIIKKMPASASGASQVLVRMGEAYFVVSSVVAYSGFETLVFPAGADGEITDWIGGGGGRGMGRDEAIADLAADDA